MRGLAQDTAASSLAELVTTIWAKREWPRKPRGLMKLTSPARISSGPTDLALNHAFRLNIVLDLIMRLQILYDIWCRYGLHLLERFRRSHFNWPDFVEVIGGVGVWHIYGHITECTGRWSTLYARHCGIVDGEILETLWSVLNQMLESCRGMSLANREEVISMFESDSNFRKIIGMGKHDVWLSIRVGLTCYSRLSGQEV